MSFDPHDPDRAGDGTPAPAPEPERTSFAEPVWQPAAPPPAEPAPSAEPAEVTPAPAAGPVVDLVKEPAAEPPYAPAAPEPAPDPVDEDPAEAELAAEVAALESAEREAPAPRGEPAAARGPLVPVLAALVVVLLGLTGYLGWEARRTSGPGPVVEARDDALASAREAARLVFSYDYRSLAEDFAAGKAVTTGEFAKEYERTTGKLVDDLATRYKAVVTADVSEASVVRASTDEVVCLVFVNQTSRSTERTTPTLTQSRLELTMERVDGRWKVAKIDAL